MWLGYLCGGDENFWEDGEMLQCRDCVASLLVVPVYCVLSVYVVASRHMSHRPEGVLHKLLTTFLLVQVLLPLLVFFSTSSMTFGDWLGWSCAILFWTTALIAWQAASLQSSAMLLVLFRLPSTWASGVRLGGKWDTPSFVHLAETLVSLITWCVLARRIDADADPVHTELPLPHKWCFTWVTSLLDKGNARTLDLEDTLAQPNTRARLDTFEVNLLTYGFDIRKALRTTYMADYVFVGTTRLLTGLSVFCFPLVLRWFLDYLTTNGTTWRGSLYVLGLSVVVIIPSMLREYHEYQLKALMLSIREVVIDSVNQQTMRLPEAVKQKAFRATSTTTLISSECDNITDLPRATFEIPVKGVQICLGLYLLYCQVHWAFLPGVAVVLAILAANIMAAYSVSRAERDVASKSEIRVRKETALLSNMSTLKCNGWKDLAADMIHNARVDEMAILQKRQYYDAICAFLYYTAPVFVSFVVLVSYRGIYEHTALTPARLVSSLVLFHVLIQPINDLPYEVTRIGEIQRSINSIEGYLSIPPTQGQAGRKGTGCLTATGTFSWSDVPTPESAVVMNITLQRGEYIGVLGSKGSGKSNFLWALAGEMLLDEGKYARHGSLAFAPATPSVFTGTILENILVGAPFDEDRYQKVTAAVSLPKPFADPTLLISPTDPTLTQVHYVKICLARALYKDADLLLLDDPYEYLSTREAEVLHEYLSTHRKTLVVSTRKFRLLKDCTKIIEMVGGEQHDANPAAVIEDISDTIQLGVVTAALALAMSCIGAEEKEIVVTQAKKYLDTDHETEDTVVDVVEGRRTQMRGVWSFIYSQIGKVTACTVFMSLVVMQGAGVFSDWWMCRWIDNDSYSDWSYLLVFGLVTLGHAVAALMKCFAHAYGGIKLNEGIHASLLASIMNAPDTFFKANLLTNLLLCFSEDLHVIDEDLPLHLGEVALQGIRFVGIVCILTIFDPWTLFGAVPVLFLFLFVRKYFQSTMRDLKRLNAEADMRLLMHVEEVTAGSAPLKMNSDYVLEKSQQVLGDSQRVIHSMTAVSCWLRLRLQIVGYICVTTCASVAVAMHKHNAHDVAISGLAIFYSFCMAQCMSSLVVTLSDLQATMLSVQRVNEYCSIESDHDDDAVSFMGTPSSRSTRGLRSKLFPKTGRIEFKKVTVCIGSQTGTCKQWCSYPKSFDGILCLHGDSVPGNHWSCCGSTTEKGKCMPPFSKHIQNHTGEYRRRAPHLTITEMSFTIPSGNTVALLERSGVARTTIMELLLKLQEPSSGTIALDGKQYDRMPKGYVRQCVTMLSATPLLLDGTIQMNLDPSGEFPQGLCEAALEAVGLGGYPLNYNIGERGRMLSDAEKQLLCVARVVMRGMARRENKKMAPGLRVLLLDNAMSNCGLEQEMMTLRVLREYFKRTTFVVVTNKLDVVTSCDSVLMLANGQLIENRDACNEMLHQVFQDGGKVTAQLAPPAYYKSPSSYASQSSFDFRRSLNTEDLMSLNFAQADLASTGRTVDSAYRTTKRNKMRQSLRF